MASLHELGLETLSSLLARGECTSRELTGHFLERIERHAGTLNCLITVTAERALAAAEAADARRARGEAGPLTGLPYVNKDIFCTEGVATTCASRMLERFVPPYTATATRRLDEAGMVMLGKTNMDEFAMGSSNETSWFGPVRNPWDHERVPGGSSGGSAAAVAARLAPAATGTDTGGSIRQPAALCGVSGLKPTYGRVSRHGLIAFASSLDQAGPMAASVHDLALMLSAMAGFDPRDSTCVERPVDDYVGLLEAPLDGLRIGLPEEFFDQRLDPAVGDAVHAALEVLVARGAELKSVSLPSAPLAIPAYYVIAPAEASSNLARYDGVRYGHRCADPADLDDLYERTRAEGFGAEVQRRILVGTYALRAGYYDAYYLRAQRVRRLIANEFRQRFAEQVDLIAGPVTPRPAFRLGELVDDPVAMYLADVYTCPASLAGLPALALPAGFADGLPVGLQLIGNHFDEARVLRAGHALQLDTDWHRRLPPGYA